MSMKHFTFFFVLEINFILIINSNKITESDLDPSKFIYAEFFDAEHSCEILVDRESFGDLGFWKTLKIDDPL